MFPLNFFQLTWQIRSLITGENVFLVGWIDRKLYATLPHLLFAISFKDLGRPKSGGLVLLFEFLFAIDFFLIDIKSWQISSLIL